MMNSLPPTDAEIAAAESLSWMDRAACRMGPDGTVDLQAMRHKYRILTDTSTRGVTAEQKRICGPCEVIRECLIADAASPDFSGVRGGLSMSFRRRTPLDEVLKAAGV